MFSAVGLWPGLDRTYDPRLGMLGKAVPLSLRQMTHHSTQSQMCSNSQQWLLYLKKPPATYRGRHVKIETYAVHRLSDMTVLETLSFNHCSEEWSRWSEVVEHHVQVFNMITLNGKPLPKLSHGFICIKHPSPYASPCGHRLVTETEREDSGYHSNGRFTVLQSYRHSCNYKLIANPLTASTWNPCATVGVVVVVLLQL